MKGTLCWPHGAPLVQAPHFPFLFQLDGIVWEDDSITYGCANATLVMNNQKGLKQISYGCCEDGAYETPGGDGGGRERRCNGEDNSNNRWPVCTTNPTDPCESLLLFVLCMCFFAQAGLGVRSRRGRTH